MLAQYIQIQLWSISVDLFIYFIKYTIHLIFEMLLFHLQKSSSTNLLPTEEDEEDGGENSCGPTGLWEALTPCNGCRNLGFPSLTQVLYSILYFTIKYWLSNIFSIVLFSVYFYT